MTKQKKSQSVQEYMPTAEEVQAELARVQTMDDFFGKEGVFARLFATTIEQMLEGELTEHLGYEPYAVAGRKSGNNRNGYYPKKVRTSTGETTVQVPRDRNGEYEPQIIAKYAGNTNELEEKILAMGGEITPTPKACRRATSPRHWPTCMASTSRRRPSARSPRKSGRWWKPGRTGHWRVSTPSSTSMRSTSGSAETEK